MTAPLQDEPARIWTRCSHALPEVGAPVELMFRDSVGGYPGKGASFLNDDGQWFVIDPPTRVAAAPYCWRPA